MKLSVDDKAIARSDDYLASFSVVVNEMNVQRPPRNMLDWFLKFLFDASYTNLPNSSWRELAKRFAGPVSVRKAQGILMVMRGKTVVGFVSAKAIGRVADSVCKQPELCRQSGGYTTKRSLFRAAVSVETHNRRLGAPVGRIR